MKQGKFAKAQQKKVNQTNSKKHLQNGQQTLDVNQALDFLLVRYHLTVHQTELAEETNRRFIQEIMQLVQTNPWSLSETVKLAIQQINIEVPWQFYQIIFSDWATTKHFLLKEIPAIPLEERIRIVDDFEDQQFQELIVVKLAKNWFINQFKTLPNQLAKTTNKQVEMLSNSFKMDDDIDWDKIAQLNKNIEVQQIENVDDGTIEWINRLQNDIKK